MSTSQQQPLYYHLVIGGRHRSLLRHQSSLSLQPCRDVGTRRRAPLRKLALALMQQHLQQDGM